MVGRYADTSTTGSTQWHGSGSAGAPLHILSPMTENKFWAPLPNIDFNIKMNVLWSPLSLAGPWNPPPHSPLVDQCWLHKAAPTSDGSDGEGELLAHGRGDVALLPEQAQQQVLRVLGPAVDARALQPDGNVVLEHKQAGDG